MITLRPATADDAHDIAAIYAPYVLGGNVAFENAAVDARSMRSRMAAHDGRYPWLVATTGAEAGEDEAVLAFAYGAPFKDRPAYRWTVETMCYVSGAIEGQGTGRLLYKALLETLRTQGFVQAIATIALPNDRQIQRHEAVGFRRAGGYREVGFKQGRWLDVGVWQRELNSAVIPPVEPKGFADVGMARG
jgi:phosphinothricin acetyltransferase